MATNPHHPGRPVQVPAVATDAIVVKPNGSSHDILLITRLSDPFKDFLAFPGGFVDYNEDPEKACLRELEEECGIKGKGVELITVAGNPKRDPRSHIISIAYSVHIDETSGEAKAGDDAATAKWYNIQDVFNSKDMAFDHKEILRSFLQKTYP